jgi:hypothetical protein
MVDESLIKQQYGQLALLLHCNKNEFARFKATFKVIGDVVNVLFNMQKKLIDDDTPPSSLMESNVNPN